MADITLKFTIDGQQQLSRTLLKISGNVQDWQPAFDQTAAMLKGTFSDEVFQSEGGAISEAWSPLKQAYALRKAQKYPGKGILEATGRMRDGFITTVTKMMCMIENPTPYFKYHQSSAPRSSNLPRRVMMKLADKQRVEIVRIFQNYARQKMN